jgi:hypothetical protein
MRKIILEDNFNLSEEEEKEVIQLIEQQTLYFNDTNSKYWFFDFKYNDIWYSLNPFYEEAKEVTVYNFK